MGSGRAKGLSELIPDVFPQERVADESLRSFSSSSKYTRALRMSDSGHEGWQLHVPSETDEKLDPSIKVSGQDWAPRPMGNHAISTIRIDHGYRADGCELTPNETRLQAELGWAIDWNKESIGKTVLLEPIEEWNLKRLALIGIEDANVVLWASESIRWNGQSVGYTSGDCYSVQG